MMTGFGAQAFTAVDFTSADSVLSNQVVAAFTSADSTLSNYVNTADTILQSNIDNETAARLAEDTAFHDAIAQLQAAINTLNNKIQTLENQIDQTTTISNLQAEMRDLRVGSQTFGVSNGNATIRMFIDESSDLTSTWSNTQHVLELDIPADADTKFYRFRMD